MAVVHDQEWFEDEVTNPIGGPVIRRPGSVRRLQGDVITESTDFSSLTLYDYFLAMFQYAHLGEIVRLMNVHLLQQKRALISVGELLKFFGVLVLMTRFEFGKRHDLWKTSPISKYIPAPGLARQVCLATGLMIYPRAFVSAISQRREGRSALFGIVGCS
jgi:Transposase IS4